MHCIALIPERMRTTVAAVIGKNRKPVLPVYFQRHSRYYIRNHCPFCLVSVPPCQLCVSSWRCSQRLCVPVREGFIVSPILIYWSLRLLGPVMGCIDPSDYGRDAEWHLSLIVNFLLI